jgi:hypothetical protein
MTIALGATRSQGRDGKPTDGRQSGALTLPCWVEGLRPQKGIARLTR